MGLNPYDYLAGYVNNDDGLLYVIGNELGSVICFTSEGEYRTTTLASNGKILLNTLFEAGYELGGYEVEKTKLQINAKLPDLDKYVLF